MADPAALQEKLNSNLRQLSLVAPETAGAISSKSMTAVNYLYEQAPKNPKSTPLSFKKQDYIPSDTEIDQFDDRVRTMEDPFSALKDLSEKRLSPASVEVLKLFYPDIYSQIIEQTILKAQEGKSDLSYDQRLQMAQLFQMPLEESLSPDLFRLLQSPEQSQPDSGDKPIDINLPNNETSTERVTNR